jgi:hypothetical protein
VTVLSIILTIRILSKAADACTGRWLEGRNRADRQIAHRHRDQPGIRVAAVNNTTTVRGAVARLSNAEVTGYETYDQIFDLLKKGEVDAFASVANDDDYANWNIPNIPTSPRNCASPGFFYTVNTPADITALNAMFDHAVAEARITN